MMGFPSRACGVAVGELAGCMEFVFCQVTLADRGLKLLGSTPILSQVELL